MCMQASSSCKMTTFTVWVCVFFVLCASIVKALSNPDLRVEIEPKKDTAARAHEELTILCKVYPVHKLEYCRMELPDKSAFSLKENLNSKHMNEFVYFGAGYKQGECGIRIFQVREKHNGMFKCTMGVEGYQEEATRNVTIIVAQPPTNLILLLSKSSRGTEQYKHGENLEISCSAESGRPAANVSLYFDEEPLISDDRTTVHNQDDNFISTRNVSRSLDWTDNGKQLKCIASHIALDVPKEKYKILSVDYPPQPQTTHERFGYVIGRQGVINVTVYANPKPIFVWKVNGERIDAGYPDQSNRLQTSSPVEVRSGEWLLILTIDSVQKSDTEKEYLLEARNNEGSHEYHIILSTSSEPAVELDAGSIIGIVVGVLVLILIIFIVIFARATGRWCFAGRTSTRNLGESSETESAGKYSRSEVDGQSSQGQQKGKFNLSRFFGRNKDKVTSTDTDTMKTVVTVEDEEKPAEPTPEGGEIVYAELDLPARELAAQAPSQINNQKTEYAEILYTKSEAEETTAADK